MDQSYFIAAHIVTRNVNILHDAKAENTFYDTFGNDRLAGLKSAWLKMCDFVKVAKSHLIPSGANADSRGIPNAPKV